MRLINQYFSRGLIIKARKKNMEFINPNNEYLLKLIQKQGQIALHTL